MKVNSGEGNQPRPEEAIDQDLELVRGTTLSLNQTRPKKVRPWMEMEIKCSTTNGTPRARGMSQMTQTNTKHGTGMKTTLRALCGVNMNNLIMSLAETQLSHGAKRETNTDKERMSTSSRKVNLNSN